MKIASFGSWIKKILVFLFALVYLAPLYIAVVNSVKPYDEVIKFPLNLPVHFTLDSFAEAFETSNMLALYRNSIVITAC